MMTFDFVAIQVTELEPSVAFYRDVMGMKVTREFTAGPDRLVMLRGEGCGIELILGPDGPSHSFGGHPVPGFETDDLDGMLARLAERGIPVEEGPCSPNPGVRFIMVRDPSGIKIEVLEHSRA